MASARLLPLLILLPCAAAFAPPSLLPRPATGSATALRRPGPSAGQHPTPDLLFFFINLFIDLR